MASPATVTTVTNDNDDDDIYSQQDDYHLDSQDNTSKAVDDGTNNYGDTNSFGDVNYDTDYGKDNGKDDDNGNDHNNFIDDDAAGIEALLKMAETLAAVVLGPMGVKAGLCDNSFRSNIVQQTKQNETINETK